jgi:hypothetical protein
MATGPFYTPTAAGRTGRQPDGGSKGRAVYGACVIPARVPRREAPSAAHAASCQPTHFMSRTVRATDPAIWSFGSGSRPHCPAVTVRATVCVARGGAASRHPRPGGLLGLCAARAGWRAAVSPRMCLPGRRRLPARRRELHARLLGRGARGDLRDFPLLGRGPFGKRFASVKETDANFRPLPPCRGRGCMTRRSTSRARGSVTVVVWAIRESGNHALAGIWHEGTDLKEKSHGYHRGWSAGSGNTRSLPA